MTDFSTETEWLIFYGWRPGPTTQSGGAWEHDAWSRVPESCFVSVEELGVYDVQWIRHPTNQACAITMAMLAMSEVCVVVPRSVLEGQL